MEDIMNYDNLTCEEQGILKAFIKLMEEIGRRDLFTFFDKAKLNDGGFFIYKENNKWISCIYERGHRFSCHEYNSLYKLCVDIFKGLEKKDTDYCLKTFPVLVQDILNKKAKNTSGMRDTDKMFDLINDIINNDFLSRNIGHERYTLERNTNEQLDYSRLYDKYSFLEYLTLYKINRLQELGKISDAQRDLLIQLYMDGLNIEKNMVNLKGENLQMAFDELNLINDELNKYNLSLDSKIDIKKIIDLSFEKESNIYYENNKRRK